MTLLVQTLSYCNSELPNIPSMQNWVLLILIINAQKRDDSMSLLSCLRLRGTKQA